MLDKILFSSRAEMISFEPFMRYRCPALLQLRGHDDCRCIIDTEADVCARSLDEV